MEEIRNHAFHPALNGFLEVSPLHALLLCSELVIDGNGGVRAGRRPWNAQHTLVTSAASEHECQLAHMVGW